MEVLGDCPGMFLLQMLLARGWAELSGDFEARSIVVSNPAPYKVRA